MLIKMAFPMFQSPAFSARTSSAHHPPEWLPFVVTYDGAGYHQWWLVTTNGAHAAMRDDSARNTPRVRDTALKNLHLSRDTGRRIIKVLAMDLSKASFDNLSWSLNLSIPHHPTGFNPLSRFFSGN